MPLKHCCNSKLSRNRASEVISFSCKLLKQTNSMSTDFSEPVKDHIERTLGPLWIVGRQRRMMDPMVSVRGQRPRTTRSKMRGARVVSLSLLEKCWRSADRRGVAGVTAKKPPSLKPTRRDDTRCSRNGHISLSSKSYLSSSFVRTTIPLPP